MTPLKYNERIHHGVTDGTTTLQGVILSSDQLMSAVNGTVGTMKDQILDQINSQVFISLNDLLFSFLICFIRAKLGSSFLFFTEKTFFISSKTSKLKKKVALFLFFF